MSDTIITAHDRRIADAPHDQPQQSDAAHREPAPPPRPARWPWVVAALVIVVFFAIVLDIVFVPAVNVWTDDAYVTAHYATVASRVSGQIATVAVTDNQIVKAGQILATIDDSDYHEAVATAASVLKRDRAAYRGALASIARQNAAIDQDGFQVAAAKAQLNYAKTDARRYRYLAGTGAGTVQLSEKAGTTSLLATQRLNTAETAIIAGRHQLDVLRAQAAALQGTIAADQAQLAQAALNRSYTRILAPIDGMVGERSVQVGNFVGIGVPLMAIVPLNDVYVVANYREMALRNVRPGQKVRIHVDAYGIDLDGVVNSVAPASGAAFSPIAPQDATGNFTKIVQRLPVKIMLDPNQDQARALRVGMSVETSIHTLDAGNSGKP